MPGSLLCLGRPIRDSWVFRFAFGNLSAATGFCSDSDDDDDAGGDDADDADDDDGDDVDDDTLSRESRVNSSFMQVGLDLPRGSS